MDPCSLVLSIHLHVSTNQVRESIWKQILVFIKIGISLVKYNEIDFEQGTLFNMKKDPFEIKNLMEAPTNFHLKLARFSFLYCSLIGQKFWLKSIENPRSQSDTKMDASWIGW